VVRLTDLPTTAQTPAEVRFSKVAPFTKTKVPHISREGCRKEKRQNVAQLTQMQHAESLGDLSNIQTRNRTTVSQGVRRSRSVTPPPRYEPLTITPAHCSRPPSPTLWRCIVSDAKTTLTASCPERLNRCVAVHKQKVWATHPIARETPMVTSLVGPAVTSSMPNLTRDTNHTVSLTFPANGVCSSSTLPLPEHVRHQRFAVLNYGTNVKQTVVHTKVTTHVNRFYRDREA